MNKNGEVSTDSNEMNLNKNIQLQKYQVNPKNNKKLVHFI